MKVFSDLQIHSRFSRATSKEITLPNLEKWARVKGINLLGTGDFTHPKWFAEIKAQLEDNGEGILQSSSGFNFILTGEISFMYSQGGKGRKVHLVILAPSVEVVEQINAAMLKRGRLDYDGRPIFGMSCPEFVEMMMSISPDIEVIPSHAWTPWFGLFGSKSGFNTLKECFQEQTRHIHAIETGLSSDPPMNWRLSQLDDYVLVSNSDSHSFWPWRLGRECTIFDFNQLTYKNILGALRERKGLAGTLEVDPNYGIYHFDGHRACSVCLSPSQARKLKDICPVCKKKLTLGVLHRVEDLADRPEGYKPKDAADYTMIIPLSEIISTVIKSPLASNKVWAVYNKIIEKAGSEFAAMMDCPADALAEAADEPIVDAIVKCRQGKLEVSPGFDGEYGKLTLNGKKPMQALHSVQSDLLGFTGQS